MLIVRMKRPFVIAVVLLAGCKDKIVQMMPPPDPHCGDGVIDAMIGEECEGTDLGGATCMSLGFDTGTLTCDDQCHLVKTLCTKLCGNGVKDPGEQCDGDAGVPGCSDWGYVACTSSCTVDRTHCITSPFQSAAALNLSSGGPATLGDLAPVGLGDLIVCEQLPSPRVATYPYSVVMGFTMTGRMLTQGTGPVYAIASGQDIVALNADGTLDRYAYGGSAFTLQPYDGGCSGQLIGNLSSGVATQSCDAGELLVYDPGLARYPTNGGALSLADMNHDGQLDVLSLNGLQLDIHLAPSFAAADAGQLPATVTGLVAADFDGDGDLDLAGLVTGGVLLIENVGNGWANKMTLTSTAPVNLRVADLDLDGLVDLVWESGDHAEVRRNQGSWAFAPYTATFGSGPNVSFAIGDVDGDGDLDFVSTRAGSGNATVSYVETNRVR
jgi:hypothetical protein